LSSPSKLLEIFFGGGFIMDKIEAARTGQGVIKLEDRSAGQVKQAIEQVSKITAVDGNLVSFEGQRIVEGHGFALQVNCYDIYECPNGYLLHTYMEREANWAVAAKTVEALLNRAPDQRVARRARGLLVQKNLVSSGH
jgi:hypothetical protein